VGGARTALFSWLHARKHGGKFILRIEDTDLERSTAESINAILEGMTWLGLEYDEGPFYQTHRFDRYNEVIQELLDKDLAYRCNCSKERLDSLREAQMQHKEKPRYDGYCREKHVKPDGPHVVRFRNPLHGAVVVDDMIRGKVLFQNEELDDLVLRRTDGAPTYNLSVVVDDSDMGITDVIRGDDHLNNTPRQINILRALGKEPPQYAHVPMILGDDGSRLSKRHGAVSVMEYRKQGVLPEALLNYLVRLGWSHGDQEIFTLDEMIELFDISKVNRAASAFNTEKLLWLNQHYIKNGDPARIARLLSPHMGDIGIDPASYPPLIDVVRAQQERARTLVEMAEISAFFYRDLDAYDENAARKHLRSAARAPLEKMRDALATLDEWKVERLHQVVVDVASSLDLNLSKVAQPLRVAVVGRAASPGIDVTLYLVGREACLRRIDRVLNYITQRAAEN
jgi:glutamyl-tRNA synthetase